MAYIVTITHINPSRDDARSTRHTSMETNTSLVFNCKDTLYETLAGYDTAAMVLKFMSNC